MYYKNGMESDEKLKEIDIKNLTSYYFDDMTKFEDLNLDYILIDEKSYKHFSVYNISYKILIDGKPLRIVRFEKINEFIRVYDGTRYFTGLESRISYIISHNYAKIKVDSRK